jgi:hypothetical protein
MVMSTLRSGLDELRGTDLRHLSDSQVEDWVSEIRSICGALEAECARGVAEIERRGAFADSGHLSITSWVEHRFQTSWFEASKQVRTARALEAMPAVREALYEGEVSPTAVGQLVAAHEASPEEFSKVEDTLVDAARTLPVRDLRKAVAIGRTWWTPTPRGGPTGTATTGEGCTRPPPSRGWSGWTATSTPRPGSP